VARSFGVPQDDNFAERARFNPDAHKSFCAGSTPRAQKDLRKNRESSCVIDARRRVRARQASNRRTIDL
jgi:hypothetical protein